VLSIVHHVSRHQDLLLHHVIESQAGTVGVLFKQRIYDLRMKEQTQTGTEGSEQERGLLSQCNLRYKTHHAAEHPAGMSDRLAACVLPDNGAIPLCSNM
jgi:hypothetical protein